jgi:hypothetical protein
VSEPPQLEEQTAYGEGGIRTRDTTIFSRVLYQLSYLASALDRLRSGKASGRAAGAVDCIGG